MPLITCMCCVRRTKKDKVNYLGKLHQRALVTLAWVSQPWYCWYLGPDNSVLWGAILCTLLDRNNQELPAALATQTVTTKNVSIVRCSLWGKVTLDWELTIYIPSHSPPPLGPSRVCWFKLLNQILHTRVIYIFQWIVWKEIEWIKIPCPDNEKSSLYFCVEKEQTKWTKKF